MTNLTHLFKVGQPVRVKNNDFGGKTKFIPGVVRETYPDHIIIQFDGYVEWYEESYLNLVYPDYNFKF